MAWAEYFARLTRGETQTVIGRRIGVDQTTVGRWLRDEKRPTDAATVAHVAQCYDGNVLEAFVAAGFLTEQEAGIPPAPRASFADMIDADPELSPEAKVHIKNQYGLLKAASAANRTVLLRDQIQRNSNLDPETKAQLLATLDGDGDAAAANVASRLAHGDVREYPRVVEEAARHETGQAPEGYDA